MELSQLNELLHDGPLPDLVGAVSRGADRGTLLQLLDAELKRREERFRLIQEYRNLFGAPVHALPPEVLARIFFFYALDKDYQTLIELRWTRLLLVCRRWRNVACSTPLLWSFVSLEPLPAYPLGYNPESLIRRVALQRERVGEYPMRVRMRVAELPTDVAFFRPYQPFYWKPSSLASLRLMGSGNEMESFFSTMVDHDYPLLTNLDIENDISHARPLLFIPDNFLLRLSSLRHLRIAGPVMFEIDGILGALSQCPQLESLRIDLQRGVPASTNQLPHIHLPDLLDLVLTGPLFTGAHILSCLRLPGSCKISFVATNEVDTLALQPLLIYLQAHCCLPDAPSITLRPLLSMQTITRRAGLTSASAPTSNPALLIGPDTFHKGRLIRISCIFYYLP
ncbi:hypothetical protein PENSPDRAFT_260101 [Peniophora sp. CONT]|nr:hypothetical protein PENSPDRAFT_260101 [Peniophora sp. CONT]